MLDKNLYNYYPILSIIHKSNPTIKLINFILIIILNSNMNQLNLLITFFYTMLLCILSLVPIKYYIKLIWTFRYPLVFLLFVLLSTNLSFSYIVILAIKLLIIILNIMIIIYTTSSFEIAWGIENLLYLFNIFNIKTGQLSLAICLLLKSIPVFLTTTNVVIESECNRGYDYIYKSVVGKVIFFFCSLKTILIKTIKELINIRDTMNKQLYSIDRKRTNIDKIKLSYLDIILLLGLFILLIYTYKGGAL